MGYPAHRDSHGLKALAACVKLAQPLMVTSDSLEMLGDVIGQRMATGSVGELGTTTIGWQCAAQDGFMNSKITHEVGGADLPMREYH
jgi:hypothetical protein